MSRKANGSAKQYVSVGMIDNVDLALRLSKSVRVAVATLSGDSGFGPVLIVAMEKLVDELTEAREAMRPPSG